MAAVKEIRFDCKIWIMDDCRFQLYVPKAELLQLKLTPIICLMNFINEKVGN